MNLFGIGVFFLLFLVSICNSYLHSLVRRVKYFFLDPEHICSILVDEDEVRDFFCLR